ncbi:leu operon leader peptide [Providencia alcalifaciens]|nr:leu operon leader peptide [Providencia alcalifaciens]
MKSKERQLTMTSSIRLLSLLLLATNLRGMLMDGK